MAITINAKTSGAGGLETTADNTGNINIQSGGSTVMSVTSSGVAITGALSQNGGVYSTQPTFRNLIINGDMKIAQRGTSFTSQTSTAYQLDRWEVSAYNLASGVYSVVQDTDVPSGQGFVNSLKLDCTTAATQDANNQVYLQQQIEAQNFNHLKYFQTSPDTVTLSFWIKSNLTGTYAVQLKLSNNGSAENSTSTQDYTTTYTISASNTWEKKTVTIELDDNATPTKSTGNALGGAVSFWFGAGSSRQGRAADSWGANGNATTSADNLNILGNTSNYINITSVQLEVGSTATDFENLPYDVELARCQRYFYKTNPDDITGGAEGGTCFTGTAAVIYVTYPVTMRATPSFSSGGTYNTFYIPGITGAATGSFNGTYSYYKRTGASLETSSMSGGALGYPIGYNGQMSFNAEL